MVCFPIRIGSSGLGVLALLPADGSPLPVEQHEFVDAYTRQAAFAFERSRLIADAQTAAVRVRAEEMRSSLLSAVSHDLRTPLAAITGAASSMRDAKMVDARTRSDLLDTVVVEAERLERLVANLREMTRLHSGPVALQRAWMPLEEMVSSALARLESVRKSVVDAGNARIVETGSKANQQAIAGDVERLVGSLPINKKPAAESPAGNVFRDRLAARDAKRIADPVFVKCLRDDVDCFRHSCALLW